MTEARSKRRVLPLFFKVLRNPLIKSLLKKVKDIEFNAGVAKDYFREIHYDPNKKEHIQELEQILKEINDIIECYFFQIINNVNELKIEVIRSAEVSDSESEDNESENSQSEDSQGIVKVSK